MEEKEDAVAKLEKKVFDTIEKNDVRYEKQFQSVQADFKEVRDKLSKDYTCLKVMSSELKTISHSVERIVNKLDQKDNENQSRFHGVLDEIIKWAILLLLGLLAAKIGI